jgi:hypothetical protein
VKHAASLETAIQLLNRLRCGKPGEPSPDHHDERVRSGWHGRCRIPWKVHHSQFTAIAREHRSVRCRGTDPRAAMRGAIGTVPSPSIRA